SSCIPASLKPLSKTQSTPPPHMVRHGTEIGDPETCSRRKGKREEEEGILPAYNKLDFQGDIQF
ncbi:unnamed protein product, partial [Arctogadus glacialis]